MAFSRLLIVLLSFSSTVFAHQRGAGCSKQWPGWSGVKFLFAFGDSYTHTGFNPAGLQPSLANPLGNPPYPGFTSAAGPNWLDFLTVKYNASRFLAYNMADGGSTMDSALVQPHRPDAISLRDQIGKRWLGQYSKSKNQNQTFHWTPDNTLFAFFIGINDVGRVYGDTNRTIIRRLFTEYVNLVEQVYNAGGRNFLFMNIPPIQRSPFTFTAGSQAVELEESAVRAWNKDLADMSVNLPKILPDSTSFVFDTYTLFARIMDNPGAFPQTAELKDTKSFCSAYSFFSPSSAPAMKGCQYALNQYFWINDMHPTYPIHNATAAEISKMLAGQPGNIGKACKGDNNNNAAGSQPRVYQQYFIKRRRLRRS